MFTVPETGRLPWYTKQHKITCLHGDGNIKFNRPEEGKDTVGWAGRELEAGRMRRSGVGSDVGGAGDTARGQRIDLFGLD